ncbi:MAG: tetratricopeptide repeat protein [Bacteroidales bacterium]|nr:tetratricopeptide repeat protein [Bacteroidales bacterium]
MANNMEEKNPVESVENALSRTEMFFEKNQKLFLYVFIAIVVLVGGYFAVRYLYVEPRQKEAAAEIFHAERYFEADSLQTALNGDGTHLGFLDIIDQYGMTPTANVARYYAGMAYLRGGQFEDAIVYLKKFNAKKDPILYTLSKQAIGDAYLELGQDAEALKYYKQAAGKYRTAQTTPMAMLRAAFVCEKLGDYKQALTYYQALRTDFPQSQEATECDKYIARAEARMNTR